MFLINHSIGLRELLSIYEAVRREHPDWWIGVNLLGLDPLKVFEVVPLSVSGVWTDNAEIDEHADAQSYAASVRERITARAWPGLYFGGVAFKYQRRVDEIERAAELAACHMDVVTTSGPGTGQAAEIGKIKAMKSALGDTPLAVASGITPDNVAGYLPFADCFLVATGISRSFEMLDEERTRALVEAVRAYGAQSPAG